MRVILASASPRRRELLGKICDNFEIIVKPTDETLDASVHPRDGVEMLAVRKGRATLLSLSEDEAGDALIISSDTLVELSGKPLGKPESEEDAYLMLRELSGKRHNVHTGIALHVSGKVYSGVATTGVYFRELSDEEIYGYIKSGEPMDKAGAYGIQGLGGAFVEKTEGDFDTVVGFSLNLLTKLLSEAGASL